VSKWDLWRGSCGGVFDFILFVEVYYNIEDVVVYVSVYVDMKIFFPEAIYVVTFSCVHHWTFLFDV
jgi:hypothetical protein